jgi:hypothetical protein
MKEIKNNDPPNVPKESSCLITPAIVSEDQNWKILDNSIAETIQYNSKINKEYTEITSLLTGLYGMKKHYIKINSILDLYSETLEWPESENFIIPFSDFSEYNDLPIKFLDIGDYTNYSCVIESSNATYTSFGCWYMATYSSTIFKVYYWGPAEMKAAEIEGIINPILPVIDACIQKLE